MRIPFLIGLAVLVSVPASADDTPPPPCSTPEFSQFDFWVGNWDLKWEGGTGTNFIEKKLNDCVIQENFDGGPFVGMSVSTYSTKREQWEQTWVDNTGSYLDFTGGLVGDRMILSRESVDGEGNPIHHRMVFYDIEENSLNWDWESSPDGKEWNLLWRIHYSRAE